MNEQIVGTFVIAVSVVAYLISKEAPNIRKAKFVDFSKVFK